jgi:hypothetical protein
MDRMAQIKLESILSVAAKLHEEHKAKAAESTDWLEGWYTGRSSVYGLVAHWVEEVLALQKQADDEAAA